MHKSIQTGLLTLLIAVIAGPVAAVNAQDFLGEPKPLAPGVLKVIPVEINIRDTYTHPMQIPDLEAAQYDANYTAKAQTLFGQSRTMILYRDVWQVEFASTGLRQIQLRFRNADGSEFDRVFWYMMYRIRDLGKSVSYIDEAVESKLPYARKKAQIDLASSDRSLGPGKVAPRFTLEGWVEDLEGNYSRVAYRDQYLPEIAQQIQILEDANRRLYNQREIESVEVPLAETEASPGIWGVAVWEDVNPRLDYVSVFVSGLTNAWRLDPLSRGAKSAKDINVVQKTLQINFWRPGDEVGETLDSIKYGIPLVDKPADQIEICRRYNLPGPMLEMVQIDDVSGVEVFLNEVDAGISLDDFSSAPLNQLSQKQLPESIVQAAQEIGYEVAADVEVTEVVAGAWWQFPAKFDDKEMVVTIRLKPRLWEVRFEKLRFTGSIDNFWIYR